MIGSNDIHFDPPKQPSQIWNAITAVATTVIAVFVAWIATQIVQIKTEQASVRQWQTQVDNFMGGGQRYTRDDATRDLSPIVEKVNDHELRIRRIERRE
jgi:hypothetical protein